MKLPIPHATLALTLALTAASGPAPASAADAVPVTPSRSLSVRGPLALSLAAEPTSTHWSLETGWPLGRGPRTGTSGASMAERRGYRLDAIAVASHDRSAGSRALDGLTYALLLDRAAGRTATWVGLSLGGPRGDGTPRTRLRLATGVARVLAGIQAEAAVISSSVLFANDPRWTRTVRTRYWTGIGPDTLSGMWRDTSLTEPADHSALWTTAQSALRWQRGRIAIESVAGVSLGDGAGPRRWAQGTARVQVGRRWQVLASIGEQPVPSLAFDGAAHPHTMIGVQVAPWSSPGWALAGPMRPRVVGWRAATAGPGRTLLRVHCRDASRVEVAGDFTDWTPVALIQQRGGWWATVLHAGPGLHRVQVRLNDGAWQAPPGLPRADDGPAGPTGAMVIE